MRPISVYHCLDYGRLRGRADCPCSRSCWNTGVEVEFWGNNLEPPYLSTGMCSSGCHHSSQAQLLYVMVRHHDQEPGQRSIRVAVNDWVNNLLVLRAEVSLLDEHLVKVPSSVFAWRMDFYGETCTSEHNYTGYLSYTRMMYASSVFRFSGGF